MRKWNELWKKICVFSILALLGMGCGYSEEEKAEMEKYKRYGEEYALLYMEEKYDVVPTVLEVECDTLENSVIPDFSPAANGWVYVKMEYDTKSFCVYVNAMDSNELKIDAYDNYQSREIKNAISQTLMDLAGGERARDVYIAYGINNKTNSWDGYLIRDYYDGHNLSQVLENASYHTATIYYIGKDTSLVDQYEVAERLGSNAEVLYISYRDENAYGIHEEKRKNVTPGYSMGYNLEDDALLIEEYTAIYAKKDYKHVNFELQQVDDIYFVNLDGTYCDIEKADMDAAENWNGKGFTDAKQIGYGYLVTTDAKTIQVYFTEEAFEEPYEDVRKMIVLQYEDEEGTVYDTAVTKECGGYTGATIYIRDREALKFSVFTND